MLETIHPYQHDDEKKAEMRDTKPFLLLSLLLLFATQAGAVPLEQGGRSVVGGNHEPGDAYLAALETLLKRIARSKSFLEKNWERLPVLFRREDAMMPDKTPLDMANISDSADSGDLVSGPDSYFTVPVAAVPDARSAPASFEVRFLTLGLNANIAKRDIPQLNTIPKSLDPQTPSPEKSQTLHTNTRTYTKHTNRSSSVPKHHQSPKPESCTSASVWGKPQAPIPKKPHPLTRSTSGLPSQAR